MKYLYALSIAKKLPGFINANTKELYYKHIHIRTGSQEPGAEHIKANIEDFICHFNNLITSMADGFDSNKPVPFSTLNFLPLNGAHRLAASLAHDKLPHISMSDENFGGSWDLDWFKNAGFLNHEIHSLIKGYSYLNKYKGLHIAILWSPVKNEWRAICDRLSEKFTLIHEQDIKLSQDGFGEFIRDTYSFDYNVTVGDNIERKVKILNNFEPSCKVVFLQENENFKSSDIKQIKEKIRKDFHTISPIDDFTTIHISDSPSEYVHLEKIILNELNIKLLNYRKNRGKNFYLISKITHLS